MKKIGKKVIAFFMSVCIFVMSFMDTSGADEIIVAKVGESPVNSVVGTRETSDIKNSYTMVKNEDSISNIDVSMEYVSRTSITMAKAENRFSEPGLCLSGNTEVDFITDCSTNYGFEILGEYEHANEMKRLYVQMLALMSSFYNSTEDVSASDFWGEKGYCIGTVNYFETGLTEQEMYSVYQSVMFDHPLFYCVKNKFFYDGFEVYLLADEEFYQGNVRKQYSQKIKTVIETFDDLTADAKSNYEIVKIVHDTIIMEADYAFEADGIVPQNNIYVHSIAGYVSDKKELVCDGYAKIFAVILNYLDIDNIFVTGWGVEQKSDTYTDEDAHAWNMVALGDDKYYYVDVTWDDLGSLGSTDIFLCLGQEIYESHKIIETGADVDSAYQYRLPECAQTKFEGADILKKTDDPVYDADEIKLPDVTANSCGSYAFWDLSDDGVMTISGIGRMWDFINDADYYDYHDCPWKEQKDSIKEVIINEGITYIGANSFSECHNLKKVTFGNTLITIGAFAFMTCENLENFILPDGLKRIGQQAFARCSGLTAIKIPDSVTFLDSEIFGNNANLKYAYIGGKSDVGSYIFSNCLFRNCTSLEKIDVSEENIALCSIDGVLYSKGNESPGILVQYPCGKKDKEYTVLNETTEIYPSAIEYAQYLEKINFPETLENVGDCAIANAPSLKYLVFPKNVKHFGEGIGIICKQIEYIENLSNAELKLGGEYVDEINGYKYWRNADEETLVSSVMNGKVIPVYYGREVSEGEYFSTSELTAYVETLYVKDGEWPSISEMAEKKSIGLVVITDLKNKVLEDKTWDKIEYQGWYYDVDIENSHVFTDDFTIDVEPTCTRNGIKSRHCLFNNCEVKDETVIPATGHSFVEKINPEDGSKYWECSICGYKKLKSITGAKVTLTKQSCIYNGKQHKNMIKSVKLGKKLLKSGTDYTVSYKNNVNIGKGTVIVKGIGNYTGTVTVRFEITVKKGLSFNINSYKYKVIGSNEVSFTGLKNANITKVVIPEKIKIGGKDFKVTAIADKALQNKKIKSVIVGTNVKTIGKEAFKGCKNLKTIIINSLRLKTVGVNALKGIKATAKIKVPAKKFSLYRKLLKGKGQGKKVSISKI